MIFNVVRHPARVTGRNEYRRPLKVFTQSKENRDLAKRIVARRKQQFLPSMAYMRDHLSPQQLHLGNRLRDKRTVWNMEVGWERFVVRDLQIIDKQVMPLN